MDNTVKIITFYTVDTPYQEEVLQLQASCAKFGLPIEVEPIQSAGSWEKNVGLKPRFILEKWKTSSSPFLWVDADAMFLQEPDFTPFLEVDFGVRFMELFQENPAHAVNTATIFVNKTEAAGKLLEKWVKRADELSKKEEPPRCIDQISLYEVLIANTKARVLPLPVSYCKIFDMDTFFIDDDKVIIEQRQASRVYKELV